MDNIEQSVHAIERTINYLQKTYNAKAKEVTEKKLALLQSKKYHNEVFQKDLEKRISDRKDILRGIGVL
jgi:hypothetical protein